MPPHLAPLGDLRLRSLGDPSASGSHELAHVSIGSIASAEMDDRHLLGDESNPWRSRILIGSILASELGVLLALFTSMFQPETDPVQFVSRLSILFAALFGLSILRRKALPATSESYPRPGCQGQGTAAAPGVWIGTAGRSAADPGDPLVVPPVDPTPIRLNPARLNLSSDQQG